MIQGDLTTFDECVKSSLSKDCSISKMWMQIPYFCGQLAPCWDTGSQWALERAKSNLVNEYFLVGMNEQMGQFVEMLEVHVPHIFKVSCHHVNLFPTTWKPKKHSRYHRRYGLTPGWNFT